MAAPAHADDDSAFGQGVNAANNWNFAAVVVCTMEVASVPVLSGTVGYVGDHDNNCSNGNILDHSGR
ncbi:hypothetical protein [Streptomyces sp. NRRL S-495]|uniref:hypothetical protein n=1 Tax=Streptomyces sp. NRRL S-495 TaxID=1609133 RepID=UPI0005F92168|nr:hypothetical protein [Streptomyces sp. NRRL S-495]KJY27631.1 hypothetical protein VR45_34350 [Streptomyces sp. NRRL S-495]